MEKRFIPLHSRSLRFYCRECEQPFAVDDGEVVPRHKGKHHTQSTLWPNMMVQTLYRSLLALIAAMNTTLRSFNLLDS